MRPISLPSGVEDADPAIADGASGIARRPEIALDIAAQPVGPALHPIDHAVRKQLLVGELVVGTDVEDMNVALAAGAGVRPVLLPVEAM